jgi:hypothetical protein
MTREDPDCHRISSDETFHETLPMSRAKLIWISTEDFRGKLKIDGTPVDHARDRVAMLVGKPRQPPVAR